MEGIDDPVLDLLEILLSRRCEGTCTVHDEGIHVGIEWHGFAERGVNHVVVLGLLHGSASEDSKISRVDQHEPAISKWLVLAVLARPALMSCRFATCALDVDFDVSVSNKLLDCPTVTLG